MYLIRVLFNFYDEYQFKQQVKLEQREWLKIAKEYGMYKDVRCLIAEKYIERKFIVNGDSYKTILIIIFIVCIIAYLLTFVFTERNFKIAVLCYFKFSLFILDSFIQLINNILNPFIVEKEFEPCKFHPIICEILFPVVGFYQRV